MISYTSIEKTPYTSDDGTELFDGFIPLKGDWNLQEQMECYYKRMPESFIPVGECQGGDLICLGIKEPYLGKIYLWDHENELEGRLMVGENVYTEDINNYLDNLYFVSETLLDFIEGLQILKNNNTNATKVISVKFSDEFLNKARAILKNEQ